MYLLCLTGTCNNWQGFYKEIFCNVCKPGQGLTVDLQPTYFITYVPYRKCNLSISKKKPACTAHVLTTLTIDLLDDLSSLQ